MPANSKTVSKLLSTLWRSPLAPGSGGKIRSTPKTARYLLNSAASSRGIGTYRTLPPFSIARTAINSSLYNTSFHFSPKIYAIRIPVVSAARTINRKRKNV